MKTPAMTMQVPLVLPPDDRSSVRLWILAAFVVVLVHGGVAYWLSRRVEAPNPAGVPDSAVMIELPPMAVAQPAPAAEVAPGPQMREAAPEPVAEPPPPPPEPEQVQPEAAPVPELPPEPKPDAVLVAPAQPAPEISPPKVVTKPKVEAKPKAEPKPKIERPKPIEKEIPKQEPGPHATRTSAPRQSAGAPGQNATQAARGSAGSSSMSAGAWQGLVSARVNSNTRYPPTAQGATGASSVSFSIDRAGRLISASLSRSSGSAALDAEAVATVRRSSPFPPPPADVPGGRFNFTKTINFRH
jgi:protein TonB